MLTKVDLNKIQLLITGGLKPVIKDVDGVKRDMSGMKTDIGGLKRDIDGLKDEMKDVKGSIRLLPTKDEYFDSMDKLMGEVKKGREEQEIIGGKLSEHNDRLEKLEEKVGVPSRY